MNVPLIVFFFFWVVPESQTLPVAPAAVIKTAGANSNSPVIPLVSGIDKKFIYWGYFFFIASTSVSTTFFFPYFFFFFSFFAKLQNIKTSSIHMFFFVSNRMWAIRNSLNG
jgi:hypothetical protein